MSKILSCPLPSNLNPLSPTGFQFSIQKLPNVTFFCQEVNLPDITIGSPEFNTPLSVIPIAGDMITYGNLNVQFLVDEQMVNYKSIHSWLTGMGFPESQQQYTDFIASDNRGLRGEMAKSYSDATLTILGPNNIAIQTVQFVDLFPIALESINFVSNVDDIQYLVGNATFKYNLYKFV